MPLVSGIQVLTNFTYSFILDVAGVLVPRLEYFNIDFNID